MPGERSVDTIIAQHKDPLLEGTFVHPSRFYEGFIQMGIKLAEDEPIGVADTKSIEWELRNLGISGKFARTAARSIAAEVRAGNMPKLFKPSSGVSIEQSKVGDESFLRRSDLSPEAAFKRLGVYQLLLQNESEAQEQIRIKEKEQQEIDKSLPSTVTINTISTYRVDDYKKTVAQKQKNQTGRITVDEIPHDLEDGNDILTRIIQRSDAKRILLEGLTPVQLKVLIKEVRDGIIRSVDKDQQKAHNLAEQLLIRAHSKLEKPGKDFILPIYIPRDMADLVNKSVSDLNQNDQIKIETEMEKGTIGLTTTYPRTISTSWASRFDEDVLEKNLPAITEKSPPVGTVIEKALLDENAAEIFRRVRLGEELTVDGTSLSLELLNTVVAPIVLNDQFVAQAIFGDIVGEMYPMPYHPSLKGDAQELSLDVLKRFVDTFTLEQIQDVLTQKTVVKEMPQIPTLQKQIDALIEQISQTKGSDKTAQQKKQALERQLSQLTKRLIGYEKQQTTVVSISEEINKALSKRMMMHEPNPKEYADGEQSVGYQRAIERHELIKGSNPDLETPEGDEYILEDESVGYQRDSSTYQGYLTLIPEGWVKHWESGEKAARTYLALARIVVPAMLPEGIFNKVNDTLFPNPIITRLENLELDSLIGSKLPKPPFRQF